MVTKLRIASPLRRSCHGSQRAQRWLTALPQTLNAACEHFEATQPRPLPGANPGHCSYVCLLTQRDGSEAVLKLALPHLEGQDEALALRCHAGQHMVRLLGDHEALGAMLLERCVPGQALSTRPEVEQDEVIADLLLQLRRTPATSAFRPLQTMLDHWRDCTLKARALWPDPGLVRQGLELFAALPRSAGEHVLLCTDLHAGNVLAAERLPWLAIDPKPFVGDPAYDVTQHLYNCPERMARSPNDCIARVAELCHLDRQRVALWMFARCCADPRDDWQASPWSEVARRIRV